MGRWPGGADPRQGWRGVRQQGPGAGQLSARLRQRISVGSAWVMCVSFPERHFILREQTQVIEKSQNQV